MSSSSMAPPAKRSRTNTPWTPAEEQRLKTMRDAGNSWAEIAKVCLAQGTGHPPRDEANSELLGLSQPN